MDIPEPLGVATRHLGQLRISVSWMVEVSCSPVIIARTRTQENRDDLCIKLHLLKLQRDQELQLVMTLTAQMDLSFHLLFRPMLPMTLRVHMVTSELSAVMAFRTSAKAHTHLLEIEHTCKRTALCDFCALPQSLVIVND